jgi:TRAP-type mannitol/chloroaromatic compound transport system permease small subunit
VRGDVVYRLWQPRTQASVDLTLYIIFFLPAVLAFMYAGWPYAQASIRFKEVSIFSPAGVPVFPLKTLIPVAGFLLLLQGIAEIIRCITCIRTGRWPQRLHDVEETESIILQEQRIHQHDAETQSGQKGA